MNNLKESVKNKIRIFLNEDKIYDELLALNDWYEDEKKKLDDSDMDYNNWVVKNKILKNKYISKSNEILKTQNAYDLKGNINAKYIYHYTTGQALIGIIEDDMLVGGGSDDYNGISFTTHPNLYKRGFIFYYPSAHSEGRHHKNIGVKIKFDFNQMKADGLKFKTGGEFMDTHAGEEEIRLKQDELDNVSKYIKDIVIFKDKEKDYILLSKFLQDRNIKHKLV